MNHLGQNPKLSPKPRVHSVESGNLTNTPSLTRHLLHDPHKRGTRVAPHARKFANATDTPVGKLRNTSTARMPAHRPLPSKSSSACSTRAIAILGGNYTWTPKANATKRDLKNCKPCNAKQRALSCSLPRTLPTVSRGLCPRARACVCVCTWSAVAKPYANRQSRTDTTSRTD